MNLLDVPVGDALQSLSLYQLSEWIELYVDPQVRFLVIGVGVSALALKKLSCATERMAHVIQKPWPSEVSS